MTEVQPAYLSARMVADSLKMVNVHESQPLLAATTLIYADDDIILNKTVWEDSTVTAKECGLTLCLDAYDSSVSRTFDRNGGAIVIKLPNSFVVEHPQRHTNLIALGTLASNPIYDKFTVLHGDYVLDPSDMDEEWLPSEPDFSATQHWLTSNVKYFNNTILPPIGNFSQLAFKGVSGMVYMSESLQIFLAAEDVDRLLDQIAQSMSNAIRNSGSSTSRKFSGMVGGITSEWVGKYQIW